MEDGLERGAAVVDQAWDVMTTTATCYAEPGGPDGHTHDIAWLDQLSGDGQTKPGGVDGHSHVVQSWTALAGNTGHTHVVSCPYPETSGGGGGIGCGF